jgi:hypothetical protein
MIAARYISQRPYVGTQTQTDVVDALEQSLGVSKAAVMRFALNRVFGLTETPGADGEIPRGKTFDEIVVEAKAIMTGQPNPLAVEQETDGMLA